MLLGQFGMNGSHSVKSYPLMQNGPRGSLNAIRLYASQRLLSDFPDTL